MANPTTTPYDNIREKYPKLNEMTVLATFKHLYCSTETLEIFVDFDI